jgi:hypothetical protein
MKKLLIAALCASALVPATPAFAQDFPADVLEELDVVCAPHANLAAEHTAALENLTIEVLPEELTNTNVVLNIPGGVPVGLPAVQFTGPIRVNGGSPNIHGDFSITQELTGGQSDIIYTYETVTVYHADCVVRNKNGNPTGEGEDGLSAERSASRQDEVIVNNPNTFQVTTEQRVVCISPSKNPGTWRNQNGYTGTCSRAVYDGLVNNVTPPTNSLPAT